MNLHRKNLFRQNQYMLFAPVLFAMMAGWAQAQIPEFRWAAVVSGSEDIWGQAVAVDSHGNSYIAGHFNGTVSFGETALTGHSNVGTDIFIAKYGPGGEFLWAEQAGGSSEPTPGSSGDAVFGIAVDESGAIYVTGYFHGTATFGSTVLTSAGGNDIYLAKYSVDGELAWARRAGGSQHDTALSVAVGPFGDVGVVGFFRGESTFGDHTLAASPSPGNINADAYVAKYDGDGNALWAISGGGGGNNVAFDVAFDDTGNIFVCGYIQQTATFSGETLVSAGGNDAFVAKYDRDGSLLWIRRGGGSGADIARAVHADSAGNVYVLGTFQGIADFEMESLISGGGTDSFLAKYDPDGELLWIAQGIGSGNVSGARLVLDERDNILVVGSFRGTAWFGGKAVISAGEADIFLVQYDSDGNVAWARRAGGEALATAGGIAIDQQDNLFIAGQFRSSVTLNNHLLISEGNTDAFIAMLNYRPWLRVHVENGQPVVRWPVDAGAAGFHLEHSPTLTPGSWSVVTGEVSMAGGAYRFVDTGGQNRGFYRLAK